ncbi:hypothetical protein [Anatilimnocola floriformis]|uniref:hypothetical protein n=1 Tax=Anatilimnocola floriformis TaxID=2948575 RepID=UPI0020C1F47A|nr:hypothetical protein [Anatilimnocola floriformis]
MKLVELAVRLQITRTSGSRIGLSSLPPVSIRNTLNTRTETSLPPQSPVSSLQTSVLLVFVLAIGGSFYAAGQQLIASQKAARVPNAKEALLQRYDNLAAVLPATGTIGYLPDAKAPGKSIHPEARFGLLRYALVPRLLTQSVEAPYIIFDSDRPSAAPEGPLAENLLLVADLQDGLKVFRRREAAGP